MPSSRRPPARCVHAPRAPIHIVHNGRGGQMIFDTAAEFAAYQVALLRYRLKFAVQVYAFCLLPHSVHVIVDGADRLSSVARLFTLLAAHHSLAIGGRPQSPDILWCAELKVAPIRRDRYLLAACRQVETLPLRQCRVADLDAYPWSSWHGHVDPTSRRWRHLDVTHDYMALGDSMRDRAIQYRHLMQRQVSGRSARLVRRADAEGIVLRY